MIKKWDHEYSKLIKLTFSMVFFVWDSEYPNKHLLVYGKEFSKIKTWDNDQPRKPPPRGGPGNTLLSFNHLFKVYLEEKNIIKKTCDCRFNTLEIPFTYDLAVE